jgi:hypothetical protein
MYRAIGRRFASHEAVDHSAEEWVRGDVHTNTVEGFFSRSSNAAWSACISIVRRFLIQQPDQARG